MLTMLHDVSSAITKRRVLNMYNLLLSLALSCVQNAVSRARLTAKEALPHASDEKAHQASGALVSASLCVSASLQVKPAYDVPVDPNEPVYCVCQRVGLIRSLLTCLRLECTSLASGGLRRHDRV